MSKIERKVNDYEFYFIYNNEEIKADKCNSNIHGSTECYVNNIRYENVPYTVKKVGEHTETYDNTFENFLGNTSFVIITLIVFTLIYKINMYIIRNNNVKSSK